MEPLTPNFDLKPTTFRSVIPAKFGKFSSSVFHSRRSSSQNRHVILNQKGKVSSSVVETYRRLQCGGQGLMESVAKRALGFGASAAVLLSFFSGSPALAESLTVAFPVSRAPEVIYLFLSLSASCLSISISTGSALLFR